MSKNSYARARKRQLPKVENKEAVSRNLQILEKQLEESLAQKRAALELLRSIEDDITNIYKSKNKLLSIKDTD